MHTNSYTLSEIFSHYIVVNQPTGVKQAVAEFLKENDLSKIGLKKKVRKLGGSLPSFKEDLVDLLFFYIGFCLEDHYLSDEEKLSIRHLKILFGISEQDLYSCKSDEIKKLLAVEVKRLLADQRIDDVESLYQVDLQDIFGLSYDRFLELTAEPVEEVVNEWIRKIASDGSVTAQERDFLYGQVLTLDRLYKFATYQKRILENKERVEFAGEAHYHTSSYEENGRPSYDSRHQSACAILGVDAGASTDQIKTAYRRLAQLHHPDKVSRLADEDREVAEERMKAINAAYAVFKA